MTLIIIHHRSSHHARNSGYARLVDYFPEAKVIYGDHSKIPSGLARWIKKLHSQKYGLFDSHSVHKNWLLFHRLLKHNQPTVVHYLNGERDIRYQTAWFKNRVRSLATFHKPPQVLEQTIVNFKYHKNLQAAIAVGANQVSFLKERLQTDRVFYIPHGVDTQFFQPNPKLRREKTLLFVGQHLRNFNMFNSVIRELKKQINGLRIQVVLRSDFASQITPVAGLEVYSHIDDYELLNLYQEATLLFLPLHDVTACNSLLEAMASGTPIVTTDLEANRGYSLGDFVVQDTVSAYVDRIVELLHESESHLNRLSDQLRDLSLQYDWSVVAKQVEEVYQKVNEF